MPGDYETVPPEQRYDFVLRHIAAAEDLGVEATHEKALYCAMALTYGEKFAQLPNWKPVLQQVADGKLSMSDAPNHITEMERIWPEQLAAN
jgi:hypothetical protein